MQRFIDVDLSILLRQLLCVLLVCASELWMLNIHHAEFQGHSHMLLHAAPSPHPAASSYVLHALVSKDLQLAVLALCRDAL